METPQTVAMAYSQEEVAYLVAAMGARYFPGLGDRPLAVSSRAEAQALLDSAARSLIVRGLLRLADDGKPAVEDITLSLIGTCVYPAHSLLIEPQEGGGTPHYFHAGKHNLTVEHIIPQPGIHTFIAYKDEGEALVAIYQLLGLEQQAAPTGSSVILDDSTLAIALDLAAVGNSARLLQVLTNHGLEAAAAVRFATQLADLKARTHLIGIIHDKVNPQLHDYTLLLTGSGYWLAERIAGDAIHLQIRPVAAVDLQALLSEQLAAAPATATVA